MLKRIGLKLAEEVANHTGNVVALITFIVWFLYTRDRVLQDKSPAAVIIIVSFLLYLPLFYAVFYILMLIPKFVCMTILLIIDKKNRYKYGHTESNDKEFERFWREEDEAYEDMNREQKEREKMNMPVRVLMNPGSGLMNSIAASRNKTTRIHIIKIISRILPARKNKTRQVIKKMNFMMPFRFMA